LVAYEEAEKEPILMGHEEVQACWCAGQ
jgi:hypothetical protein